MKKFWLVLLSLGLVMAFSVSAFAVDVKVGAEYFVGGLYLNKTDLQSGEVRGRRAVDYDSPSTAFFYQRLRVGTDFIVSPCLKLVTRFTAMERIWGGQRSEAGESWPSNMITENTGGTAGTRAESENIAFDLVYIDYTSPVGLFRVGYQPDYVWGTVFGDRANGMPAGQIMYAVPIGPVTFILDYAKEIDNSWSAVSTGINATRTDRDSDSYRIAGIYNFKGGEAGALFLYNRDATHRGSASFNMSDPAESTGPLKMNIYAINPYVKAKIGPVAMQAEVQYWFGDAAKWEGTLYGSPWAPPANISISAISAFVDATANFGMFYFGGSAAYLSGDDPATSDKIEGGINTAGLDWDPCLIMFNTQTAGYWVGPLGGKSQTVLDGEMSNAWFFQGRVGVKPTSQWDVMLSVSYAMVDKKQNDPNNGYQIPGGTYGTEVDLTGTYKITNNLSYMLGAGYVFTGDYFKGDDRHQNSVNDDFILLNKLTLSF